MSGHPSASHGEPSTVVFQKTKRGRQMLCRAGYNYVLKRTNKDGSDLWSKCNATLKVKPNPFIILHETSHNHPPRGEADMEIDREMYLCTETLQKNINKPVTQIYGDAVQNLINKGIDLLNPLPQFDNIKKKLYKLRNESQGAKKINFHKACELEVPKRYEDLLFAEYKENQKRILIFAKKEMVKYLKKSTKYLIDGTFKICPKCFCQVYTIHADIGSNQEYANVVPVLYALLPDKTRATYEILFQMIKSQVKEWQPTEISMDFEVTAILAIKDLFPEVKILGCYFHFNRCLWRKAKQLGVVKSKLGVIHVKLCTQLAHLPPDFLDEGWLYVMSESPNNMEVTKFNDYFVQTWLEHEVLSKTWNIYKQCDRTNNMVESWNAKIKKIIPEKPNIAQFLNGIKKDANFYFSKSNRPGDIQISKRKIDTIEMNQRIHNIIQQLLSGSITVGHCLEKLRF
ncbi:hypothetical protein HW555_010017 [Spodoptera exigua]|uniref:MULE transposase domain-containing protein n=1 Tax=Spodoptera exigua TaxID=7107 RepID=A0A835G872_SPOEX|nr:hypothetical protein HW555_010017 [Spodoptera exigua]